MSLRVQLAIIMFMAGVVNTQTPSWSYAGGYWLRVSNTPLQNTGVPAGCPESSCIVNPACLVVDPGQTTPYRAPCSGSASWTISASSPSSSHYSLLYDGSLIYTQVGLIRLDSRQPNYYAIVNAASATQPAPCLMFSSNGQETHPVWYAWWFGTSYVCGLDTTAYSLDFNLVDGGPNYQALFEIVEVPSPPPSPSPPPTSAAIVWNGAPTLEFRDSQDPSDAGVTLVHDPADPVAANALVCSGEFHAADVRINGTNTTMAQIIQRAATLESEIRELTQRLNVLASIESDVQMLKMLIPPPPPPPHSCPTLTNLTGHGGNASCIMSTADPYYGNPSSQYSGAAGGPGSQHFGTDCSPLLDGCLAFNNLCARHLMQTVSTQWVEVTFPASKVVTRIDVHQDSSQDHIGPQWGWRLEARNASGAWHTIVSHEPSTTTSVATLADANASFTLLHPITTTAIRFMDDSPSDNFHADYRLTEIQVVGCPPPPSPPPPPPPATPPRTTANCRTWCASQGYGTCGHVWCYNNDASIACEHGCETGSTSCSDTCQYGTSHTTDLSTCQNSCSFCTYNQDPTCMNACKDGCAYMLSG